MGNLERWLADAMAIGQPCWFPGLADGLIAEFWADTMFDAADYSTDAWLGSMQGTPRAPIPGITSMQLEPLPPSYADRFPAPPFSTASQVAPQAIANALTRLEASGAGYPVTRLIRSVHCIAARGPGFDCSHSDPSLPFSVFVSVPLAERDGELRLAESLLHEAMHLQLTLIERQIDLVGSTAAEGYSPWQRRQRPLLGLVHGLYVFAAIQDWLTFLIVDKTMSDEDRAYARRRLRDIGEEIAQVTALVHAPTLMPFARTFAAWLLKKPGCRPTLRAITHHVMPAFLPADNFCQSPARQDGRLPPR